MKTAPAPPRCPAHPDIVLRPAVGVPLLMECLYGCRHLLVVEDSAYREAMIEVWDEA